MSATWRAIGNTRASAWRRGSAMTTIRVRSLGSVRLLSPGLVFALLLVGVPAPLANADAVDTNFLAALKSKGINFVSAQSAIIAGHEVCDELDLGRQKTDVASDVMKNSDLDDYHAGFFVGVSVAAFCPRHSG
ncbi:hypothetical protein I553_0366 [Mycobacterium xenopi 4042]|nr:hypothetical protein I553_0366 [Mycobacterium xenopi 4042]